MRRALQEEETPRDKRERVMGIFMKGVSIYTRVRKNLPTLTYTASEIYFSLLLIHIPAPGNNRYEIALRASRGFPPGT